MQPLILYFKIPRSFSSCNIRNLGRCKIIFVVNTTSADSGIFLSNFQNLASMWPSSILGKKEKDFGNTTESICGALPKPAQLFGSVVEKTHIYGPLTPLPQFHFRSVLCAFRLNTHKLVLSVWKMHFCFRFYLLFYVKSQELYLCSNSSTCLSCAARGEAVGVWAGFSRARRLGAVQGDLVFTTVTAFAL